MEKYIIMGIRVELMKVGHVFLSHSDTEVVLHAWEQWGPEMTARFIGMFAFSLYDAKRR